MTYSVLMALIECCDSAKLKGLRLWSLVLDHRIVEARVRRHADGAELYITVDGAPSWSHVFTPDDVEPLFEAVSNRRRLHLMGDGWQMFGAQPAPKLKRKPSLG